MVPNKGLPPLESLIDTEESSIELSDKDLGNELSDEEYRDIDNSNEEELYELTDDDFGNYDDEETDDNFEFGLDNSDSDFTTIQNEETKEESNYTEEAFSQRTEEDINEVKTKKTGKIKEKNKKELNIDFKKYYKIAIIIAVVIASIIMFLLIAKFIKGKVDNAKNKNANTKISSEVESSQSEKKDKDETVKNDSFEIKEKDGLYFVTIQLSEDTSGIYQALYEKEDGKFILCETVNDDYSKTEAKEVELSCYNSSSEDDLKKLEKVNSKFIVE